MPESYRRPRGGARVDAWTPRTLGKSLDKTHQPFQATPARRVREPWLRRNVERGRGK